MTAPATTRPTEIFGPECLCSHYGKGITGWGPSDAEVMAIGIAPGRVEMQKGKPLQGPSGEQFDRTLRACGWSRSQVYCTNLICWFKDKPEESEIAECWPRLKAEIEERQPKLIIALGALASEWLTGYKVGKVRGGLMRFNDLAPTAHLRELNHERAIHLVGGISQAELDRALALSGETTLPIIAALDPSCIVTVEHLRLQSPVVMATWHPAATLPGRNPSLAGDLVRDFRKIRRFMNGDLEPVKVRTEYVQDRRQAQETLYWLSNRWAALDVETTFDTPERWGRLLCLSISVRLRRMTKGDGGIESVEDEYVSFVFPREVLDGLDWPRSVKWGFHNGPFDRNVLRRELRDRAGLPVDLPIEWDSMFLSYSCDERPGYDRDDRAGGGAGGGAGRNKSLGPGYHNLDQLVREYGLAENGFFKDETKDWIGQDPDASAEPERSVRWQALYRRNALDAAYTVALPQRLPLGQSASCYRSLLLPAANAYADVQRTGIRIDVSRLAELESTWTAERERMEARLTEWAADIGFRNPPKRKRDLEGEPFNPGSPMQLATLLFGKEYLAIKSKVKTKTGRASTSEDALQEIADDVESVGGEFVRELIRLRKYANTLKYLPIVRKFLRPDGRVHPTFLPLVTGRYSALDPPMQTFPQPYKLVADGVPELAVLKSIVIPSEGCVLVASDYSQLEIHVGAHLSGDPLMLADLNEVFEEAGKPDYHSRVTRNVLKCPADYGSDVWEKVRRGAKVFTFGIEFGEGANGLAKNASKEMGERMSPATAQRIINAWYARYEVFRRWQREQVSLARKQGYIENPFGFVRRFPLPDDLFKNQMVNCSIQGTASQHCTLAMIDLVNAGYFAGTEHAQADPPPPISSITDSSGRQGQVLLTIHDDILSEVPEDRVDDGLALIKRVMETPRIPGWPGMLTEAKVGYNWYEMHKA